MVNIANGMDKFGDVLNVIFIANSMVATVMLGFILYQGEYSDNKLVINVNARLEYFYISILIMMAMGVVTFLGVCYQAYKSNSSLKWLYVFMSMLIAGAYVTPLWVLMGKMTNANKLDDKKYSIDMSSGEYDWLKLTIVTNVILLVIIGFFWTVTEWFGSKTDVVNDMKRYCLLNRRSETDIGFDQDQKGMLSKLNDMYGPIEKFN